MSKAEEFKEVELPSLVTVSVEELHQLRRDSAMLAALKKARVEEWQGYKAAVLLNEYDPDIQDIRLGWVAAKQNKERRKQEKELKKAEAERSQQ